LLALSGPGAANLVGTPAAGNAPERAARAPEKPKPPTTGVDLGKRLSALPAADRQKANAALVLPKSDPRYPDADKWLRARGLR
jgi:hypothetical protein